jgi:polysaccharide biosynthesis transport protein
MTLVQVLRAIRGRGWMCLTILLSVLGATLAASVLLPKKYTATASIVIDSRRSDPVSGNVNAGQLAPGYVATQLDIIGSRGVALKVVDKLNITALPAVQQDYRDDAEGRGDIRHWSADEVLLKSLKVQPGRDSGVVRLHYTAKDPVFASQVANAFAEAYMARTLELRVEPAKQTAQWFDDQLRSSLKDKLERAVASLTAFQQKHGITGTDQRVDVENARLLDLSAQLVSVQSLAFQERSKEQQLAAMRSQGTSGSVPDVLANAVVQRLKADISAAESRLTDMAQRLGDSHPDYRAQVDQIASLRKRLESESAAVSSSVRSVSNAAQEREGSLRKAVAEQTARVMSAKQQGNQLAVLARDVESAQQAYDSAQQRVSQTRLEAQLDQTNVTLLSPAIEPIDPSSPRLKLNLALALVLGLCLGPAIAVLREWMDRRTRASDDLLVFHGVPLLGDVPSSARVGRMSWGRPKSLGAPLPGRLIQAHAPEGS